jgi:4-diphosphocytidyl-2-C-methyl-D-erythritol kinase
MKLSCPIKINLFLKLVGKRADGYHKLESVFALVNLYDFLEVNKSSQFSLKISGEFANGIDSKNNILTKILDFFITNFKIDRNLEINLEKNIPVGAGLGGGSSDGAYFMMALNEIFKLQLSKEKLQEISLNFGSDIAFFFEKKSAIVRGRGEIIKSININTLPALLINPGINLSTKEIFNNFKQDFSVEISDEEIESKNLLETIKLPNDLTNAAIASCPEVKTILDECYKLNSMAAKMSGSGSTCFAIFNDDYDLKKAYNHFKVNFPQFFVREIKILSGV